jgi:membrane-associated phospholipid phosphatase
MHAMHIITGFGDPALVLPISGIVLVWLAVGGFYGLATRWVIAVGMCGFATALVRFVFHVGREVGWVDLPHIPSGHTSGSTLVYGTLALIAAHAQRDRRAAIAAAAAGAVMVGMIAFSRIATYAHTGEEVLAGMSVGLAVLFWFGCNYLATNPQLKGGRVAAIGILLTGLALHGERADIWPVLEAIVAKVRTV